MEWADLPEARFAQPREEHLLPLHVVCLRPFCVGVAVCARPPDDMLRARLTQARRRAASAAAACGALEGPPVCLMQGCKPRVDCMTCITCACQTLDVNRSKQGYAVYKHVCRFITRSNYGMFTES